MKLEHTTDTDLLFAQLQANEAKQQVEGVTAATVVPLHKDVELRDLEPYCEIRRRFRGRMHTQHIDQFALYANEMAFRRIQEIKADEADPGLAPCFVDAENMAATVFFNLGSQELPGHGDFTARLKLPVTADMKELLARNDQPMDQKIFAEWLEDWAPAIEVRASDGSALPLTGAVAAVRRITIGATSETTSEEKTFGARRSAMSEVEAKNQDQLPAFIDFTCEPYHGLEERTFSLRVSLLTGEKPRLTLRIIRLEHHEEEMATGFQERLMHELDGNTVETFIGTFQL